MKMSQVTETSTNVRAYQNTSGPRGVNYNKLLTTNLLWAPKFSIKPSDRCISTFLNISGFLGENYIIHNSAKKSPLIMELQQTNVSITLQIYVVLRFTFLLVGLAHC